ncbi:hypothetical protein FEM48_Zijuj09G0189900 [Ziziphus jujuba var. spinosa]|uniref:Integrator complex subunit 7 n=1 Tax=Ziziphus jujuba var. spinosa TaxID=714518 RepID=A0A978UUR4_ZIZJJ|nr:hypothetical protein FEM48_Zijuj09G0189900 [Ziziphus jujuba var. spinosa]
MERTSAACAMEWSIELEKGLRSKLPGRPLEAISQFGSRLQLWSQDPEPTLAAYHMFDLIPGEDRLFANAILLRLAEAFRVGDEKTRVCVVKVFLSEYKQRCKQKGKGYKGLLSKSRVHNQLELLNRVKAVFDNGDVNSRALALALYGCWADFANDKADIRYLVLSSLVSPHVLEVKASLFAAGCFCKLSDDFPYILLEMLPNMMALSETLLAIRVAGARVFAKMDHTYSIANKAYKTGLQLFLDTSEEDFQVAMLVSLSKLASMSMMLISEQVEFLFSFLNQEKSLRVRATALRCLLFIISKRACQFPVNAYMVKALSIMLDEPELPLTMQCEALRILHKMLLYAVLPDLSGDLLEFVKLSTIIENASLSPVMSKSLLAFNVLVELSIKLKESRETNFCCSSPTLSKVISLITNRITLLVKPFLDLYRTETLFYQEVKNLLNLLLLIVGEDPDLGVIVLDHIFILIRFLSIMDDNLMASTQADKLGHDVVEIKGKRGTVTRLKLVYIVYRFVVTYLESLKEAAAITTLVFDKVKLLVENICDCNLFDCYTHTIYSLLLHCRVIWGLNVNGSSGSSSLFSNLGASLDSYLVEHELITITFAKKLVTENNKWPAYKIGIYSACQGAWFMATFIFQQLITQVHSDSCHCWLKSLLQFADSERKFELLMLSKQDLSLATWLESKISPLANGNEDNINKPDFRKEFEGVYNSICSSQETLEVASTASQEFYFQRWFLSLRVKLLQAVTDVLKTLGTTRFVRECIGNNGHHDESLMVEFWVSLQQITQISPQLNSLAKEFDLVTTSFCDMDRNSSKIISALALSCSLLAFIMSFALFIPNLPETFTICGLENPENGLPAHLVQNLAKRLWHLDHEISTNLCQLVETSGQIKSCFHLQSRKQEYDNGCEARDVLAVCNYAVSGVVCLISDGNKSNDEETILQVIKDGLQLLFTTLTMWMQVPFRTPKHYFRLRPRIGSELFVVSETKNREGIYILPGYHLSLSICLQLRNIPSDILVRVTKLYCMLECRISFQEPKTSQENNEQSRRSYKFWENNNMVELNDKLFRYVTECSTKRSNKGKRSGRVYNDGGCVNSFVCFKPNKRGQGFSSCLLDISGFPVGSYRIKWHSCCIDNEGNYWSLIPLNAGPIVTVQKSMVVA